MILGIHPYVVVEGRGREAIAFYQEAIDAQVLQVQTFGDVPENPDFPTPKEMKQLIINAHLKVGNADLMLSDTFPGQILPNHLLDYKRCRKNETSVRQTSRRRQNKYDFGRNILEPVIWTSNR
jgi:uncharacterized glyoxalase superfamily protein PhnB